ncbi:glycosyl hydrolase family 18 protein [Kitasatospora sp. NPDC089797]|uniref:glycosyl hydrolase family 18 protein n=1 Tax=Kitasatospora sp. NPDC089797 TaxID=3155298 RepID=UPI00343BE5B6
MSGTALRAAVAAALALGLAACTGHELGAAADSASSAGPSPSSSSASSAQPSPSSSSVTSPGDPGNPINPAPSGGTPAGTPSGDGPKRTTPALEAWVYPGSTGEPTCQAPAEYRDGRLRDGVLKAEYWQVGKDGGLVQQTADNLPCNGFSDVAAADIKAHSAAQYVSVSAMDRPTVAALVNDPARRTEAVSQLTQFTQKIGFTGVDIDFEDFWNWSQDDERGYEAFISELARSLHSTGLRLQIDGPVEVRDGDSPFNYTALMTAGADQLVIMDYGRMFNTTGGQCLAISPHDWVRDGVKFAQSKVPDPDRLVIGLASYGFSAPDPCDTGKIKDSVPVADIRKQAGYSDDPATVAARRDAGSGEVRWSDHGTLYDYTDQAGMDAKLAVLKELGVTRVSVWVLGGNPWFSAAALGR